MVVIFLHLHHIGPVIGVTPTVFLCWNKNNGNFGRFSLHIWPFFKGNFVSFTALPGRFSPRRVALLCNAGLREQTRRTDNSSLLLIECQYPSDLSAFTNKNSECKHSGLDLASDRKYIIIFVFYQLNTINNLFMLISSLNSVCYVSRQSKV